FLAFLCDALDGRIARLIGKESLFGKEFDSLADIVSFGVAPSLMMFFLILSPTEGYPIFRQIGWLIGFIYLLCTAVRLARFNVITHPLLPASERQSNMNDFVGLPVPAAAAVVASLVLIMTEISYKFIWFLMPGLMLLIAWLMVSTIRYPSFKNIEPSTQIKFRAFLLLVIVVVTLILFKEITFALIFLSYIFYGLIRHLCRKFNLPFFQK
ncbi:MAG: CDP-diacylglycerol--serine O-phosphatidyltransferase, partial [Verrucomicrobia bacterium]